MRMLPFTCDAIGYRYFCSSNIDDETPEYCVYKLSRVGDWLRISWRGVLAEDVQHVVDVVAAIPGVRSGPIGIEFHVTLVGLEDIQRLFAVTKLKVPTEPVDHIQLWTGARRPLYPYQADGVRQMLRARRGLLADSMGLGKTSTGLVWAESVRRHFQGRPAIILVKRTLIPTWLRELLILGIEGDICVLESRNPEHKSFRKGAAYYILNPEIVRDWWPKLNAEKACAVVMDEAHVYKDGKTKRSIGANMLCVAPYVLEMTGTPMPNRPNELWNLLNMLHPRAWGSAFNFLCWYAGGENNGYGYRATIPTNVDELRTRMSSFYLRRRVEDVGLELPKLTRTQLVVSWDEATLGETLRQDYQAVFKSISLPALQEAILSGHMGRQVLSALDALRKITSQAKMDATIEYVHEAQENDESVVIFCWQRAMAEKLAKKLKGQFVHGAVSMAARTEAVEMFQRDGGVLAATYDTLSEGVTLTRARIVVMHDLHWVPKDIVQAEKRINRIGQTRPCLAVWVSMANSIDEIFARALERKLDAITKVVDKVADAELQDVVSSIGKVEDDIAREISESLTGWIKS